MPLRVGKDHRWKGLDAKTLRKWLGIQGLGNLVTLEPADGCYAARIENADLPLIVVGTGVA